MCNNSEGSLNSNICKYISIENEEKITCGDIKEAITVLENREIQRGNKQLVSVLIDFITEVQNILAFHVSLVGSQKTAVFVSTKHIVQIY